MHPSANAFILLRIPGWRPQGELLSILFIHASDEFSDFLLCGFGYVLMVLFDVDSVFFLS